MGSGRAGGETARRTTTTCSSSPITRANPWRMAGGTRYHFVTDGIGSALEQAREAADGKDVMLWGGAEVVNQYLAAGLLNELELHIVPVLLGGGARLFDDLGGANIKLEQVRAVEAPGV